MLMGAFQPFLTLTGTAWAMTPIATGQISSLGYEVVNGPGMLASNIAQGGATLAVAFKTKNKMCIRDRDKLHMADVKNLFLGGLMVRRVSAAVMLLCLFVLWVTKANWKKILARGYQIGLGIATAGVAFLAGALIVDFNTAFTVFHEIFFTNDLWLFDPAEDYMIRMLPEVFFYDMALRIGGIFIISMLIFLAVSVFLARQAKKDENERKIKSTYE